MVIQPQTLRFITIEDQVRLLVAGHGSLLTRFTFLLQTVVCQSCFNGILSQHYKAQRTRSVTEQEHLKYRNILNKICIIHIHVTFINRSSKYNANITGTLTWAVQFDRWKAKLLSNLSVFYLEGFINLYIDEIFKFNTFIRTKTLRYYQTLLQCR